MVRTNAFEILGASPADNLEKLKDLLDEKELLSDDSADIQNAYSELTNPRKRIVNEIEFFSKDDISDFCKLVTDAFDEKPTIKVISGIFVKVGKWFESDKSDLIESIETARNEIGFATVNEADILNAVKDLENQFLQSANEYFSALTKRTLVSIFNNIVLVKNYESFFVDKLIATYEIIISETLTENEDKCFKAFDEIESICDDFNNNLPLSSSLDEKVSVFISNLKQWDKYAQPLQVNMQKRGGQHGRSEQILRDLRNKVVGLCNSSQQSLTDKLEKIRYSPLGIYGSDVKNKLNDYLRVVDNVIKITNAFQSIFAELDFESERLSSDEAELQVLRDNILGLISKTSPSIIPSNRYTPSASFPMPKVLKINEGNTGNQSNKSNDNTKIAAWIIIGIMVFLIMIGIAIASSSNSSSSSSSNSSSTSTNYQTYTVTLDKDGGSGGTIFVSVKYGDAMPYATAPSKTGYEFGGYFTSKNGSGTQYYTATMSSKRNYDKKINSTLYAYWIEKDGSINLTTSNFETYFNFTSSCSVSRPSYGSAGTATYTYSISPKSSFKYSQNSKNPSSITVTIGLDISMFSSSYGTPSEYKITVTLYKSSGYSYSGSQYYSVGASENYWSDGIYSVNAKIYN